LKDPWKALPWVASISLHATAFFFLAGFLTNVQPPPKQESRIDLALSFSEGSLPGASAATRHAIGGAALRPRAAGGVPPGVRAAPLRGVSHGERQRLSVTREAAVEPGARTEPADGWEESWSTDEPKPGVKATLEESGSQITWGMVSRKLLRKRDPKFPPVLSALGQEVECEARFTVAPSGGVISVEIMRSSGYTEIDAGVEAALRDYLFSRADGSTETVGTVRFHYRLEKTD
jgi:TonB family protein